MDRTKLTAKQAAAELDISLATLYAYVSRGLIRSEVMDRGRRTKRYLAEDVARLKRRKAQRRDPTKAVEGSLNWGLPVMESSLTLIEENRVYYRGIDASVLAQTHQFEQVAELIWTGELASEPSHRFSEKLWVPKVCQRIGNQLDDWTPVERFQVLLPLAAAEDPAAFHLQPKSIMRTGSRILRLLTAFTTGAETAANRLAPSLAAKWCPDDSNGTRALEAALILCADHGLNVSSFTARCVASARSHPYQVVLAGLAALQGAKHGRETERFEALLREVNQLGDACAVVVQRLRREESLPGFGHPLYPEGDPRATLLIQIAEGLNPDAPALKTVRELCRLVEDLLGEKPTLDAGLVSLCVALGLPPGSGLTLFALGRTAGWIGQALETYETDRLIRPRARYVGVRPGGSS